MLSKEPTPDQAERNAFFPSPFSLAEYVPSGTDFDRANGVVANTSRRMILLIGTDERYLQVECDLLRLHW